MTTTKRRNYKQLYEQIDAALLRALKQVLNLKSQLRSAKQENKILKQRLNQVIEDLQQAVNSRTIHASNINVLFNENEQMKKELGKYGLD